MTIIVGLRVASRVKDAKDFLSRPLSYLVGRVIIIGSNIDANSYVGASGNAYAIGIAQANFEWIGAHRHDHRVVDLYSAVLASRRTRLMRRLRYTKACR